MNKIFENARKKNYEVEKDILVKPINQNVFKLHYVSDIECSEAFVYLTFIYIL